MIEVYRVKDIETGLYFNKRYNYLHKGKGTIYNELRFLKTSLPHYRHAIYLKINNLQSIRYTEWYEIKKTFKYPETWVVERSDGFIVGTVNEILN